MRRWFGLLLLSSFAVAQAPQSPRQALIELIRAPSAEVVNKHMPDVLLNAMATLPPEQRKKQQQSMMVLSMIATMSGSKFQTFETGPTFATFDNPRDSTKVEMTVERDDLAGDLDTMEFGIHVSKDGKPQELPFDPRILVEMKMEKNVWKLSRIGGSASIQLDDPKVADLMVKRWTEGYMVGMHAPNASNSTSQLTVMGNASSASAIAYLRTLNTAEVTYAASYPQVGYTCRLSDLGGSLNGKSPDEHGRPIDQSRTGRRCAQRLSL
jgi:hypothetical protein